MRERALECERQLIRERTQADVTGAPSICPRSQRLQRTVADLMRWEDEKHKKRSVQQHRRLEEQKRHCTFKPKVRASSVGHRWTRSHGQGSNGKSSLGSTPSSTTSSTFLSSEPLSFEAFQDRLHPPTAARCRSAGRQWIKGSGSLTCQNSLPLYQKSESECSFADSPEHISPGSPHNGSPGSGGDEPAPEVGPAQDSPHLSDESRSSHPTNRQGSPRQISTSPVRPSTGLRLQRSLSGNGRGRCLARIASFGRSGKVASRDASTSSARGKVSSRDASISSARGKVASRDISSPSAHCNAPCNVVEYRCDWEVVLAVARRGGA